MKRYTKELIESIDFYKTSTQLYMIQLYQNIAYFVMIGLLLIFLLLEGYKYDGVGIIICTVLFLIGFFTVDTVRVCKQLRVNKNALIQIKKELVRVKDKRFNPNHKESLIKEIDKLIKK